ncbi:uncharacterized protein LOC143615433 [Bidens hawaiensis]|uniref:uncharacterized protein LOC143615433 n=1 Tax=Bidens hawaiensis TaxID=980011 RepID=UPI00404ABD01
MRQRRWLELIKDYGCDIKYYPGKANVVVDALKEENEEVITTVKCFKLIINLDFFEENNKRLLVFVIQAKGKSVVSSSKTQTKTTTVKTREKKVYSLPGQKFDVPEEREPLRIFYESLSKQIPASEMAEFWMMEHGMLSPERAKKAFEKKKRKQKEIRVGTPVKSPPPPPPPSRVESAKRPQQLSSQSRGESSKKPQPVPVSKNGDAKPNKRVLSYSDDDEDDLPLSHKRRNA